MLTEWLLDRPRAYRQWHEADELARCHAHQPEELLHVWVPPYRLLYSIVLGSEANMALVTT